jgi:hypothetical protein
MLVSVASFLPIIIVGPIADVIGTTPVVLGSAVFVIVAAAGSIVWAHPTHEGTASADLIDAADPVALTTTRSLTRPIPLEYVDENAAGPVGLSYISSPVEPGKAGPAREDDHAGR